MLDYRNITSLLLIRPLIFTPKSPSSSSTTSSSLFSAKIRTILMTILKNSSTIIHHHPIWLLLLILFQVFTSFSSNLGSSFSFAPPSYETYCSSFVPEANPDWSKHNIVSPFRFLRHTGYYSTKGNDTNLRLRARFLYESSNSLFLRFHSVRETDIQGLFSLEASLTLRTRVTYYHRRSSNSTSPPNYYPHGSMNRFERGNLYRRNSLTFRLSGFWSESSGNLCVVGDGYGSDLRGKYLDIPAFLKLYNLKNSTKLTSLITGTLESLVSENDANYFEPISVMMFPKMNYEFTLVSEEFNNSKNKNVFDDQNDFPPGLSFHSLPRVLCSMIFSKTFNLKYSSQNSTSLRKFLGHLPSVIWFDGIECLGSQRKPRFLIRFPTSESDMWNYRTLDPKTTLVGEGIWDEKKNQLDVVACRFLYAKDSWADALVGDCSTRLVLRFPAVWTIGKTSSVVGYVWSNKTETEFGYFEKIRFEGSEKNDWGVPLGLKYEYTMTEKVKKWCPRKRFPKNNKGKVYAREFHDMRFDLFVKSAGRKHGWGFAKPLSVGNWFYNKLDSYRYASTMIEAPQNPTNISYQISLRLHSSVYQVNESWLLDISAEGIYDKTTRSSCMVGCRNVEIAKLYSKDGYVDCEILVSFQFPDRNSKEYSGYIKGSIESKRKKSDPYHFEPLVLSSAAFVINEAHESILRTDVEIIMALMSNMLACVFAVLQLFHLRKNPDVVPFVSITMLLTLTLACTIPLMLELKSIFMTSHSTPNVLLGIGGWLEAKQVTEGVTSVVLLLLQARLLQLTWSARRSSSEGDSHGLWITEKEAMFVSLPVYAGWAFLSIFFTWRKRKHDLIMPSSAFLASYKEHPIWDALKSYADILLDGFLLPQILVNLFRDSRENALAYSYYIGTTLVRLLPHAYGLYKAQTSAFKLVSTAWDVIITFGALLFATILYLQQRFGGRFILRFRSKEDGVYEKVANVGET